MTLLQVMLLIALIGAVTATGFQLLRANKAPQEAATDEQLLAWSDQAIAAFAAAHSRLPCPASSAAGKEDCNSEAMRGYLPIATLDTFFDDNARSQIGASGFVSTTGALRYIVIGAQTHAGEAIKLTQAANLYQPLSYDAADSTYAIRESYEKADDEISYDAVNGLDLCLAIARVSPLPFDASKLNASRGGASTNIAYAVAIDRLENGSADAIAADATETNIRLDPEYPIDGEHTDRVRVRTRNSLAQTLGCDLLPATALASARPSFNDNIPVAALDLAADAVDLDEQVKETQDATAGNAEQNTQAAERAVAMSTVATVLAGADVAIAGLELSESIGMLAKNVFLCAITFGLECWRIPPSTLALSFNFITLGNSIAALTEAGIALGVTGDALAKAQSVEAMAAAATQPKEFNLAEAVAQAYVAAEGDCKTVAGTKTCEPKGMRQAWEEAKVAAADANAKESRFYKTNILPWREPQLSSRIPGYGAMSNSDKATQLNRLKLQISSAERLVDELILLEDLEGRLKSYNDQIKLLDEMVKESGQFKKATDVACAGSTSDDKSRCASNKQLIAFAKTCERNGVIYGYDPSDPLSPPQCYAAINQAIQALAPQIAAQKQSYQSALSTANAAGATRNVSPIWIEATKDPDGNIVTPAYQATYSPYAFRYPNSWGFCTLDDERISGCSAFAVLWAYWKSGDYLPLVRTSSSQKWLSYGDAYRAHKELVENAKAASDAEKEAHHGYVEAVRLYEELSRIASAIGSGEHFELWGGPHDILKAIDDRGVVGPDRNAKLQSEAKP